MMLSPDNPLCWKDAVVPKEFKTEASCILVRNQLTKDLDVMNVKIIIKID